MIQEKGDASDTDSEDFTSGSEAIPSEESEDEADEGEFFVGLIAECNPGTPPIVPELGNEEEERNQLLNDELEHMSQDEQELFKNIILSSETIACTMKDLRPSEVPIRHHFDLVDDNPIHHRVRRMAPKHNQIVQKEIDDMPEAGIIVPATSA